MDNLGDEPAFPGETRTQYFTGMTLRDYFAGQALTGQSANPEFAASNEDMIAEAAYRLADAMIAERAK